MSFKVLQIPGWKSRAARPTWKAESCCCCKLQLNAASCNPLQIHSSSCKPLQNRPQLNAASCSSLEKHLESAHLQNPSNCKLSNYTTILKSFLQAANHCKTSCWKLQLKAASCSSLKKFFKLHPCKTLHTGSSLPNHSWTPFFKLQTCFGHSALNLSQTS